MSYIVYVGSFDPFHLGHLEAAVLGLEYIKKYTISDVKALVFVPNNPRKGKSNRSPLHRRLFLMSKLFPIYKCGYGGCATTPMVLGSKNQGSNPLCGSPFKLSLKRKLLCNLKCNSDWLEDTHMIPSNKMIIDNRSADIVLKNKKELLTKFRDKNKEIIGICGSDIVLLGKPPKWSPDRWLIFERNNLSIPNMKYVIGLDKTKYQHISSSDIRNLNIELKNALPIEILEVYIPNQILTHLSDVPLVPMGFDKDVKNNLIDGKYFIKEMKTEESLNKIIKNNNLWKKYVTYDIVRSPKIIKIDKLNLKIYLEYVDNYITLWDMIIIDHPKIEIYMIEFLKILNNLHHMDLPIIHGDMNPSNILCNVNDSTYLEIVILDFGKTCKSGSYYRNLREWYQFWSSITYFSKLYGVEISHDKIKKWKKLGKIYYTYQYNFNNNQKNQIKNIWKK